MKRKSLNLQTGALLFCLSLLTTFNSCSLQQQDYVNTIPGNATEVLSVNLQSLAQKAGLPENENQSTLNKLTEVLKTGLSMELQQQIENIVKNPNKLGIDYTAPVYYFHAQESGMQGIIAKINDSDRLKNFLKATQTDELFDDVQQIGNYNCTYNDRFFIAFNETTLLVFPTFSSMNIGQMHNDAKKLFSQTEENSITHQKSFIKLQSMQGDIKGMGGANNLTRIYSYFSTTELSNNIHLEDLKFIGSLNFENGKINMKYQYYTENEILKALLDEQVQSMHPFEGKYLPYFPQSTLMLLTMGIDGEKIYKSLQAEEGNGKILNSEQMVILQSLLNTLHKDISIGFTGMSANGTPSFVAYVETKNNTILQSLYELLSTQQMKINRLDNGDYQLQIASQMIYFGIRGTDLFVTNDSSQYNRIAQNAEPSILESDFAHEWEGKHMFFVINTKAIFDLPLVKMATGFLSPERRVYINIAEQVDYIGIDADSDFGQIYIVLRNKNTNALKQMIDIIKTIVGI